MAFCTINFITRGKIVEEYKSGATTRELSEKYGCAMSSVYTFLREAGVDRRPKAPFDSELADNLREEYESGATSTTLAQKYGITKAKVCNYIREAGGTIRSRGPVRTA